MTRVHIYRDWTGTNPPEGCPACETDLKSFSFGMTRTGMESFWKCSGCGVYVAWRPMKRFR